MKIQDISARLSGLAVFRALLDDPILSACAALVRALAGGAGRGPASRGRRHRDHRGLCRSGRSGSDHGGLPDHRQEGMIHAGEGASDQRAVRHAHHPDADVPEGERAQPQDRHLLRRRQECQHAPEDRQDGLRRTG